MGRLGNTMGYDIKAQGTQMHSFANKTLQEIG
jgi:hypothetical protein